MILAKIGHAATVKDVERIDEQYRTGRVVGDDDDCALSQAVEQATERLAANTTTSAPSNGTAQAGQPSTNKSAVDEYVGRIRAMKTAGGVKQTLAKAAADSSRVSEGDMVDIHREGARRLRELGGGQQQELIK